MDQKVLQMSNIEKHFAGVYALKGINFDLKQGEVHALLGENGAGKSTLIKVLGGIYKPDSGTIAINGEEVIIDSVNKAQEYGIGIIHQEIVLVPYLTVAENIFLGRELQTQYFLTNKKETFASAEKMVKQLGIDIDVRLPVEKLTIAQQQMVEIIKAISFDAKILVMDEPTSSLTDNEVGRLFETIANITKKGVSVIYISHRLNELFQVADRVTVIRDGRYIGTRSIKESTPNELISMMVGWTWDDFYIRNFNDCNEVIFSVEGLSKHGVFENVSFSVKKGEVVGFSGLVGAGRSEIMMSIFGADHYDSGRIFLNGEEVRFKNSQQAVDYGVALVPEDRKRQGLILSNTVGFNITLANIKKLVKRIFISEPQYNQVINEYMKKLNIKAHSIWQTTSNLSGGNQQKVVLAKALATDPKLLILDEPTRGVDVGAKKDIYSIIDGLARDGIAVILVSSELPEIINMSDRVYVVRNGRIQAEIDREDMSQENIMRYATGGVI